MAVSTARIEEGGPPEDAADWLAEIDSALKREDSWRKRGKKVVQRYRDERGDRSTISKVNILWSNTEVLRAALYSRQPKPDVRRRFPDTKQTTGVSRAAAEVVERSVAFANDVGQIDEPLVSAINDMLLPGRGTVWISYEPEIEGDEGYGVENVSGNGDIADRPEISGDYANGAGRGALDADAVGMGEPVGSGSPRIVSQELKLEYVYWEDFCHGKARKWCDVPWVARRHVLRKDQFKSKFPNAKEGVHLDYKLDDASDTESGKDGPAYVEVWEIWDRPSNRRLYVGRGYADVLQSDDDPYGLTGLFPCPRPLYSVTTTDRLIPNPEFLQYQDQANELDTVATRINRLLDQMQFKGIYDAAVGGDKSSLKDVASAGDGEFLPADNWIGLKEKGGIEGVFGFWPIERIAPIIAQLTDRAMRLTQQIYEVTGISDVIRGATDPRETKGAQQLKAQFGSMRMQARQREVQRFVRDCYRLEAEIIAEHFTEDTLKEITGLEFEEAPPMMGHNGGPPMMPAPMGQPAQTGGQPMMGADAASMQQQMPDQMAQPGEAKPTWSEIMAILRSDKMRSYRIDIETDTTALEDAEAEKSSRIEFMDAVNSMLEKAYLAATTAPMMLPIIRETFLFGIRSFKVGRSLEQAAEDAFDQLIKTPPQQPQQEQPQPTGPDPEIEKGKIAIESKKVDQDGEYKKGQLLLDAEKLKLERDKHDTEVAKARADMSLRMGEQNQQLMVPQESPDGIPLPSPVSAIEAVISRLDSIVQTMAISQANQQRTMAQLAATAAAPKRVVRGPDGRVVGVEPVPLQ